MLNLSSGLSSLLLWTILPTALCSFLNNDHYTLVKQKMSASEVYHLFSDRFHDGKISLNAIAVDQTNFELTIRAAYNEFDQTPDPLSLSEILLGVWQIHCPDLLDSDIMSVVNEVVVDEVSINAIAQVRDVMKLPRESGFTVSPWSSGEEAEGWEMMRKCTSIETVAVQELAALIGKVVSGFSIHVEDYHTSYYDWWKADIVFDTKRNNQ